MGELEEFRVFDDMDELFEARLKGVQTVTRSSRLREGEVTLSSQLATIEVKFVYRVFDKLHNPCFVAVERRTPEGPTHLIYEVVGLKAMHFQMPGVESSIPKVIRLEMLDRIRDGWERSEETWIDVYAVPTGYRLDIEDGLLKFTKTPLTPLTGAYVHLLSDETVKVFLCYQDGVEVGTLLGFNIGLKINIENVVRYHMGVFGFSVDYEEPIIYREHNVVRVGKIGELVDRFFSKDEEGIRYASELEVVCFDPQTFEVKWRPVQYVLRHKYEGRLLRFLLETGRSVTVTPSHSVFVLREGRIECVNASEVRAGDFLVSARRIPLVDGKEVEVDLLKLFKDEPGVYIFNVPASVFERHSRPASVDEWKWWYWKRHGMLPASLARLLSGEERKTVLVGCKGCGVRISPTLRVDEDLARLLGYYAADGHINIARSGYKVEFTLGSHEEQVALDIVSIMSRKFGVKAALRRRGKRAVRLSFSHRLIAKMLASWVGRGVADKRVPEVIFNSPRAVRRAFLEAWITANAGVSVPTQLLNGVMYLLLMDGCVATTSPQKHRSTPSVNRRSIRPRRLRFQLKFPKVEDLRVGEWVCRRRIGEPLYPASQLPNPLKSLFVKTLKLGSLSSRVDEKDVEVLEAGVRRLLSYCGLSMKDVEQAGCDRFYRANLRKYLVRWDGKLLPKQSLFELASELAAVKRLVSSELSFLRVVQVEEVEPSSRYVYDVSVPGAENFLAGFGGVFCHNTGVGKSNLTAFMVRRALENLEDLRVVVFDVAGEYPVHLLDLLQNGVLYVSERSLLDVDRLAQSQVVPETIEDKLDTGFLRMVFENMSEEGCLRLLSIIEGYELTLGDILETLKRTFEAGRSGAMAARRAYGELVRSLLVEKGLTESTSLEEVSANEEVKGFLLNVLDRLRSNLSERAGLRLEVNSMVEALEQRPTPSPAELVTTPEELAQIVWSGKAPDLTVVYIPEPIHARMAVSRFVKRLLLLKKARGLGSRVLVVLDEAQEYIPDRTKAEDWTDRSNRAVEALLRQGRKYRAHCWLATQRVAHLNVNALQQLHSYFVSTLPRFYDRMVIADAFSLSYDVLEKTTTLDTGEWLFVSYKATRRKNVPVFIKTPNNEGILLRNLGLAD